MGVGMARKARARNKTVKPGRDVLKLVPHKNVGGVSLPGYEEDLRWQSPLERDAIYSLALCHDVTHLTAQRHTFTYRAADDKERKYTPDLVFQHKGRRVLCEVKTLLYLLRNDIREQYATLARIFQKEGDLLHFLTDDQLRQEPLHHNVTRIMSYKNHAVSQELVDTYVNIIGERIIPIADLLRHHDSDSDLANIYAAIMRGHLCIDWHVPLGLNTPIYIPTLDNRSLTYEQILHSGEYGLVLQRLVLEGGPAADRVLAIQKSKNRQIPHYNPLGFF